MRLATTTGDFELFHLSLEDRIRCLHKAGFRHIDLSLYDNFAESPFMQPDWVDYTNHIKALAQSLDMDFIQAHSPNVNPLKLDDTWEASVAAAIRSIEVCGMLDIPHTVVHSGWARGMGKEEYFEKNRTFYSRLFPYAEACNVNVCIENSTKCNMGEMYYFITGEDMREFITYVGHPKLKACWDTGHANCEGPQYAEIMALGDTLACLHINDNHGKGDEHIIPFLGSLCLDEVMHALIDSGYRGDFTFESTSSFPPYNGWLLTRPAFGEETRLLNPPLFLQEHAEKMLYDLGVYVLNAYGCFDA